MKYLFFVLLPLIGSAQKMEYDLNEPVKIELPKEINQISGIIYNADSSVFAEDDDHGSVYKISLQQHPKIEKWKFEKAKDYEDIALVDGMFYILNSDGSITAFKNSLTINHTKNFKANIKGKNEFETLYFDPSLNKLVMLCKDCKDDKKEKNTALAFDLKEKKFDERFLYTIHKNDIEKITGEKIKQFKPSAATINPVTKNLYVLSSINKLLLIISNKNVVSGYYKLDRKLFQQPEGICFTPSGTLLISNEASGKTPGTILIFNTKENKPNE